MDSAKRCLLIQGRQKVSNPSWPHDRSMRSWTEVSNGRVRTSFHAVSWTFYLPCASEFGPTVGKLWPMDRVFVRMAFNFLIAEDNQKENDSSHHMEIIWRPSFSAHKSSFIGTQLHLRVHIFSVAALVLQEQIWIILTGNEWLQHLKYLLFGPL